MRRRDFIAGLGGAATWPLAVGAQQRDRIRRIGALLPGAENDPEVRSWFDAFARELTRLGWVDGVNVRIEQRWTNNNIDRTPLFAKELVELQPDVILTINSPDTAALQRETRTIPIVFAVVNDPVGQGFVASLPRPGGNLTGFIHIEGAIAGKWLQMIKEIAPHVRRAAAMYNPDVAASEKYYLDPFEAAARALAVEAVIAPVRNNSDIELTINSLGREQGGLIMLPDAFMAAHRAPIISAAALNQVPTIYVLPAYAREGGLLSYGPRYQSMFRDAAGYVDRILKGDRPADLPVQVPTRYDLVINLKTAKALGLTVPATLLVFANEVIE